MGSKVHLRPLVMADVDRGYYQWFNDPEVTRLMLHGSVPETHESATRYLEEVRSRDDFLHFAIVDGETDKHIGCCSLQDIDWVHKVAEKAIIIGEKEFWGRGYGREATYLMVRHGFEALNLHRIFALLHVDNIGERRSNEAVGFRVEGTLREAMFKDGRYHDRLVMGILSHELRKP